MADRYKPRGLVHKPFDPAPSIERALELLRSLGIPFALVGRLAVWAWVPAGDQEYTKDVQFAVPQDRIAELERLVESRGFERLPLSIGGFGIRDGDIRIDFIDRRVDFGSLFADAVNEALKRGTTAKTTAGSEVPVAPPEYVVAMKLATGDP